MKRKFNCLSIGLCSLILLTSCGANYNKYNDKIHDLFDIDIPSEGEVIIKYDSHGGFHNDGTTCYAVKFEDNNLLNQITSVTKVEWIHIPFNNFCQRALYGISQDGETYAPYITIDNETEPLVPQITNGYYCFIDRQGNIDVNKVSGYISINFSLAIYDINNFIFYLCEKDT